VKHILKIEKRRKCDKSPELKEFARSGLNFERHTNWVSNVERHTYSGLNIEISPCPSGRGSG
jgi:hypothetical protein